MAQIVGKVVLGDTSDQGPALASVAALVMAWKGPGNDNLNTITSDNDGAAFPLGNKRTYGDTSDRGPALTSHDGVLYLAWKGSGNQNLNVADLVPDAVAGSTPVGFEVGNKVVLDDTTEQGPALTSHDGALVLCWKGAGNDNLNTITSTDGGGTFGSKSTFGDSSDQGPALASHNGRLFMAWKGSGNQNLNVAELVPTTLAGSTPVAFGVGHKVVLGDTTDQGPALASHGGILVLAWKGAGNDNLNILVSGDNGVTFGGKATFDDTSTRGPALVSHNGNLFMAWKGSGNDNLNVARIAL